MWCFVSWFLVVSSSAIDSRLVYVFVFLNVFITNRFYS